LNSLSSPLARLLFAGASAITVALAEQLSVQGRPGQKYGIDLWLDENAISRYAD
jgi:hypothetical protein